MKILQALILNGRKQKHPPVSEPAGGYFAY